MVEDLRIGRHDAFQFVDVAGLIARVILALRQFLFMESVQEILFTNVPTRWRMKRFLNCAIIPATLIELIRDVDGSRVYVRNDRL